MSSVCGKCGKYKISSDLPVSIELWKTCDCEPVSEPASTGEPPHDSGCIFLSSRGIENCNCRAARPSEPSAPQPSTPAEWRRQESCSECDGDGCANCAPQTSAEPCPICGSTKSPHAVGLSCRIPTPIREINEFPAAPQPVSGDAPKVEEFVEIFLSRLAGLTEEQSSNVAETLSHMLRPYFPHASQTPPVDAFPEWWLKEWDDALASAQEYERDAANANPESGYAPQQTMTDEEIQVAQEATSTANVRRMIAEIRRLRVATPASTAREQKDKNDN